MNLKENLLKFLNQAKENNSLKTQGYFQEYLGCKVRVSFGQAVLAKVPWIAFLSANNEIRHGIYPVFLFYKKINKLILSYGLSEEGDPGNNWANSESLKKINDYLLNKYNYKSDRYGKSYVYEDYDVSSFENIDFNKIETDLNNLINIYKQTGADVKPNTWIFQGNPNRFNVLEFLEKLPKDYPWAANQYSKIMKPGDKVYFWISGVDSGIYGIGHIISEAFSDENQFGEIKVKVDVEKYLGESGYIPKQLFLNNSILSKNRIITSPQGSNFPVSPEQAKEIENLLSNNITEMINNPTATNNTTETYSRQKLLEELFIEPGKFDQIINWINQGNRQIIFQGPPGTGKTFFAQRIALYLTQDDSLVETIQFHPSYGYEDFIEGYRPNENGFILKSGIFKEFCQKANNNPSKNHVMIIDEINRGNLSKIFGELMYLLEYRNKGVKLTYSQELFKIPPNLLIIGTMNTADRSLAIMDYALRRRFCFVSLQCQYERLQDWLEGHNCFNPQKIIESIKAINQGIRAELRSSDYEIGHSYFMKKDLTQDLWEQTIAMQIKPLLEEYFFDQPEKVEELINLG